MGKSEEKRQPEGEDGKTSWIYHLNKEELQAEAKKFGLCPNGTVDELRARLSTFIKEGKPEPSACASKINSTSDPESDLLNKVRKWNCHFDGGRDAVSFLERLEELRDSYGITPDRLLRALPEVFRGKALLWYRNNKALWTSWDDFMESFRLFYLPPRYKLKIEDEIRNRTQGDRETVREYVTAIQTLIRRHGNMPAEQQLERIYSNLRPSYRHYIRRVDFKNLPELLVLGEEYENVCREEETFRPPPTPSQSFMPETSYQGRMLPKKTSMAAEVGNPQPQQTRLSDSKNKQCSYDQNRNSQPSTLQTTSSRGTFDRKECCWRCGDRGHMRFYCRNPPKIFCSFCGQSGKMTKDCSCHPHSGNRQGAGRVGGPTSS